MDDYKWIGLVRKFYNCPFYNDSNAVQMFLHIFLNAQREDRPYFDQITMRGQFRTSIKDIMQFLQVSRKSARRSLDKLKAAGIIHIASLRRNGVLITIREFSKFLSLEHMRGGWVKLYYDLDFQDFFEDAEVLHLYLHILLHSYSPEESYGDPLWFDFKKISASTGISLENIRRGLLKLRKAGILNVGYNGQKKLSSVHLIEFPEYIKSIAPIASPSPPIGYAEPAESSLDSNLSLPDGFDFPAGEAGIKAAQKESKEGPKDFQKVSPRTAYESSTNYSTSDDIPDTYKHVGQKEGQKPAHKRTKDDAVKTLSNNHGEEYAREHIFKENRDKRIENIHYYNYSPACKFSSIEELLLDEGWVRSMQELYSFAGKKDLYAALMLFLANLKCRKEKVPEDLKAFLDYFCNWYKRNERILRQKLKGNFSPQDYGKSLWEKCMAAFARIVSEGVFTSVFQHISFESFDDAARTLTLCLPNNQVYRTLEDNYVDTLGVVLRKFFGTGLRLQYRLARS